MQRFRLLILAVWVTVGLHVATASDKPLPAEVEAFRADGTLNARASRARYLEQHRLSSGLRSRATYLLQKTALEAAGRNDNEIARRLLSGPQMAFPFSKQPELRSKGIVKTLTVLIDFKDHRASAEIPELTATAISSNIYGDGTDEAAEHKPFESVKSYYRRASQGAVTVEGNVLDWHHFANDRDTYEPDDAPAGLPQELRERVQAELDNQALFNLISAAIQAHDDAGHDFSQYDNDNDGDIDLVTVLYAGPRGGWGSFWWAYRWEFFVQSAKTTKFDGKRLRQFVFQFVDVRGDDDGDFNPRTLIHEMGHAFGLPDYYDYQKGIGPDGGVGGLDIMDANVGNHNAFSRWLLGWIDPEAVAGGAAIQKTLNAASDETTSNKAVAVFPGLTASAAPSQEMFIVENRFQVGNDELFTPGNGLLIWHIDATVNQDGDDFLYDNSYTDKKLLRLVRADNANDFAHGEAATATTFFTAGKEFSPSSTPSSAVDSGPTGVVVSDIAAPGNPAIVRVGFEPVPSHQAPQLAAAPPDLSESFNQAMTPDEEDRVDLSRLESFDQELATATPESLKLLWNKVREKHPVTSDVNQKSLTYKVLLTHLALKDGEFAADELCTKEDCPFAASVFPVVMEAWEHQDAKAAIGWYLDDKRAELREAAKLSAGRRFMQSAFSKANQLDTLEPSEAIERLQNTNEVWGAVEGLRDRLGGTAEAVGLLKDQLKSVKKNRDRVESIINLQESLREVNKVKDLKLRSELQKIMSSEALQEE